MKKTRKKIKVMLWRGLFVVTPILAVVGVMFLLFHGANEEDPPVEPSASEYQIPEYLRLDDKDTYWGAVDITGLWVNVRSSKDTIEFYGDGSYQSTRLAAYGAYEMREGYIALTTVGATYDALRMVKTESVDILLQRDDAEIPYTYRRVLPEEELDNLQADDAVEDDVLRHYISSVKQILRKSVWNVETVGVDKISIGDSTIKLYADGKVAAEWSYEIQIPDEVPYLPPYVLTIDIDGVPRTLILDAGSHPEYNTGFRLTISNDDNILLRATSKDAVVIEEP